MEINENEVYTPGEVQKILKISPSTTTRLIKNGIIHAAKIGKQYRILGKELLRMLSPKLEDGVGRLYNKGRRWLHEEEDRVKAEQQRRARQQAGSLPHSVTLAEKTPQ